MNMAEVAQLLAIAGTYQANLRMPASEQETAVKAWYLALDERMTLNDAQLLMAELASQTQRIHPGTLNTAYLESIRPPHQQGIGRPHLPLVKERVRAHREPLAVGAAEPVKPSEVSEYVAKRQERTSATGRVAAWQIECPYCQASVNEPCHDGQGNILRRSPAHPSRLDALKVAV